ncbi:hypothetical protein [Microcoleus sp. bin38.metabat.b11b12b14.051]|uniref:hypothetical protein n=1 Tax=Microcoleus sp. bin38.metabat.b11b12b14.051 TaxID=2742709 RepID=UPI0025FB4FBE|nr:hypothetical protein [Microcoleus sp. bin38.metabat.b11b12b14.051]
MIFTPRDLPRRSKLENIWDSLDTKTQKYMILASNQARDFFYLSQCPKNIELFSSIDSKQIFGLFAQILSLVDL